MDIITEIEKKFPKNIEKEYFQEIEYCINFKLTLNNLHENLELFHKRLLEKKYPLTLINTVGININRCDWKNLYAFLLVNHAKPYFGIPSILSCLDYDKKYFDTLQKFLNQNFTNKTLLQKCINYSEYLIKKIKPKYSQSYCFNIQSQILSLVFIWEQTDVNYGFDESVNIEFIDPLLNHYKITNKILDLDIQKEIDKRLSDLTQYTEYGDIIDEDIEESMINQALSFDHEISKESLFEIYTYISDNMIIIKSDFIKCYNHLLKFEDKIPFQFIKSFKLLNTQLFTSNPFHKLGTELY